MTARIGTLGLLGFLLLSATPAGAADTNLTGQELLVRCQGTKEMLNADTLYCKGYLEGMEDLTAETKSKLFCPPAEGVTDEQLRQAYMTWAKANAGALGGSARAAALAALRATYPCK
jgi:hypothetical protein